MKNLIMLFIFSSLFFISAAPINPAEAEISQFVDLFVKKWNQHNPRELNELWAEKGDLMNPAGEWEKGKAHVLKILSREHLGVLRDSKMKQEITNILILSPTLAWVDANVSFNVPGVPSGLDHHLFIGEGKQSVVHSGRSTLPIS